MQLVVGVRSALRGERGGPAFGVAAVWLAIYAGMVFGGLLLLLVRRRHQRRSPAVPHRQRGQQRRLAHDPVSIVGPGLYTLCAVMLAERVAPAFVLWWMARTMVDADVAVG